MQVKIFLSNHRALGYCARELKEKTSFENGFIDGEAGVQPNWSYDSINGERAVQRKTIRDRRSYRLISRLQMGLPTKNFERLFVMNDSIQEFNESRMGSNVYGVVWECSRIGIGVCLRSRNLWVRVPPLLLCISPLL